MQSESNSEWSPLRYFRTFDNLNLQDLRKHALLCPPPEIGYLKAAHAVLSGLKELLGDNNVDAIPYPQDGDQRSDHPDIDREFRENVFRQGATAHHVQQD